jgi:streptogramin lyase
VRLTQRRLVLKVCRPTSEGARANELMRVHDGSMRRRAKHLLAILSACMFAAACSGDSDKTSGDAPPTIEFGALPAVVVAHGDYMWALDRRGGGLAKIDPQTNRVVDIFKVGDGSNANPRDDVWDLDASDDWLWITAPAAHALLKIDPATGQIVERVRVGDFVSDVYAAAGSLWFQEKGELIRFDPGSAKRTASFAFGSKNVFVGDVTEFDEQIWVVRDRSRYVAGEGGLATFVVSTELLQINPRSNRIVDRRPLGSSFARGGVNPVVGDVEPSDDGLWMSRPYENRLLLLEPFTGEILLQFPIDAFGTVWEFAVVDGDLWAGDLNGSQVMWIDPESRERELFDVGRDTSFIGGGFGSAWVPVGGGAPNGGRIVRLDPPAPK